MSCVIYHNVPRNEIQDMDREKVEMMVEIYESADDFRTQTDFNINRKQTLQSTGSECVKNRSLSSVVVCLVVLCVLLLTAVIVLCVLIYTNNHQFHINNKNITQQRDQLLTKYTNISQERDQLLTKYTNITQERNQLLTKYTKLTEEREAAEPLVCRDGWIYYQCSFYYVSSELKTWTESRRYCRERGADLIIINNKEEEDFINSIFEKTEKNRIWIGLSDSDEEGKWKWVDGSSITYNFWRSGEPNGQTRENCVESYSGWNDLPCTDALKWICERNILK